MGKFFDTFQRIKQITTGKCEKQELPIPKSSTSQSSLPVTPSHSPPDSIVLSPSNTYTGSIDEIIQRIKQKAVDEVVELNPAIQKSIIDDFEQSTGISLPEELVLFYTEIGNGCKLKSLRKGVQTPETDALLKLLNKHKSDRLWEYESYHASVLRGFEDLLIDMDKINEEFPYKMYWNWEDDPSDVDIEPIHNGNIELINIGCGETWNIIVTGEERGKMWNFADVGISPSYSNCGFLSWFERLLDHLAEKNRITGFLP